MTPKQKAEELVEKFYQLAPETFGTGKAMGYGVTCALACVEEMITLLTIQRERFNMHTINDIEFLENVKDEINKLWGL